ncbi:MAG: hypothetical protein RLZ61_2012, partial [Planctomycetota bacterium]
MRIFSFLLLAILLGLSSGCKSKKPPVDKNADSAKQTPAVTTPATTTGTPVTPPVVNLKRNAVARTGTGSKLGEVFKALELYANDNNGKYPPPYTKSAQGSPLLSWRVLILPYIEQQNLFNKFNQNEPWDGPTNKPLLSFMPKMYLSSGNYDVNTAFKTTFLAPVAKETIFSPAGGVTKNSVSDGLSNTILIADVDDDFATEWTRPVDLNVNAQNPALGLTNSNPAGFMALFGDGSVKVAPNRPLPNVWAM